MEWLWRRVLPKGKLTIWEGDPDKGKSTITLDVAARVTTGRAMPGTDGESEEPGSVLIVAGEDDYADTIKPRMIAAGGDDSRVILLPLKRDEKGAIIPLTLPSGIERIRRAVQAAKEDGHDVKLIIIDPITNYLGEKGYTGSDVDVRKALFPLGELAAELGAALLVVRHLNKNGELKSAMYRGSGSIAFTGAARSTFVVAEHHELIDTLVLCPVKANLVPRDDRLSYLYRLEPSEANPNAPHIRWTGTDRIDADRLLKGKDSRFDAPQRDFAEQLIADLLGDGPRTAKEMAGERSWPAFRPRLGSGLRILSASCPSELEPAPERRLNGLGNCPAQR